MAKTSQVNRNKMREKMAKRDKSKRRVLKDVLMDRTLPVEDRFNASLKLAQMPRNGAAVRVRLRCELTGRFLVVRGDLRTYKIHLGSGNILMTPDDQYLCIVAARDARDARASKLFLPFDDDPLLSLILSKAFLLADDTKITDPAISRQIAAR